MDLTTEQLERIKDYARLFLRVEDIAVLTDVDANLLRVELSASDSEAARAYAKGKALGRLEVAQATRGLLGEGNAAALTQTQEDIIAMEED